MNNCVNTSRTYSDNPSGGHLSLTNQLSALRFDNNVNGDKKLNRLRFPVEFFVRTTDSFFDYARLRSVFGKNLLSNFETSCDIPRGFVLKTLFYLLTIGKLSF